MTAGRRRLAVGTVAIGLGLMMAMDQLASSAARAARIQSWALEAGAEGAFIHSALAHHDDLLVVERLAALGQRDDLAWAVVLDTAGRARFHTNVADVGKVYDSAIAKRALAATAPLVQELAEVGIVEVDVPVGAGSVLRAGFTTRALDAASRQVWTGAAVAVMAAVVAGLLLRTPG